MDFSRRPDGTTPVPQITAVSACGHTKWWLAPLSISRKTNPLHVSALTAYEMHTKKKDTDIKVGQLLTIEGGIGATTKKAMNFGMAYYAQWKLTNDSGLGVPPLGGGPVGQEP